MKDQSKLIAIFSSIFISLITIISVIIFSSLASCTVQNVEDNGNLIPEASPLPNAAASCSDVPSSDLQSCCEQWAIDNQLATISCVGYWELQNGTCAYVCE